MAVRRRRVAVRVPSAAMAVAVRVAAGGLPAAVVVLRPAVGDAVRVARSVLDVVEDEHGQEPPHQHQPCKALAAAVAVRVVQVRVVTVPMADVVVCVFPRLQWGPVGGTVAHQGARGLRQGSTERVLHSRRSAAGPRRWFRCSGQRAAARCAASPFPGTQRPPAGRRPPLPGRGSPRE